MNMILPVELFVHIISFMEPREKCVMEKAILTHSTSLETQRYIRNACLPGKLSSKYDRLCQYLKWTRCPVEQLPEMTQKRLCPMYSVWRSHGMMRPMMTRYVYRSSFSYNPDGWDSHVETTFVVTSDDGSREVYYRKDDGNWEQEDYTVYFWPPHKFLYSIIRVFLT